MKRLTCSAHDGEKQCRAYTDLILVRLDSHTMLPGTLELPRLLVIALCRKHFKQAGVK